MHLFINSLAASAGGGLTYIRNVLPVMAATEGVRVTVALNPPLLQEFQALSNLEFLELDIPPARRFWYEQSALPQLIRNARADVLLSAGNFALRRSPVPQILLSRNSIYNSADFYRDLIGRREYRLWLDTRLRSMLARKSIAWADVTVAPSEAFAAELTRWTGKPVRVIHHGFDREAFMTDSEPLSSDLESKLLAAEGALKLLFVSHYNYYRNFETLIRALPPLRGQLNGRAVRLLLTCRLESDQNPGAYRPESAKQLIAQLGVGDMILELGTIPYSKLHHLYKRANLYVTPAYTETFAHPLVEAMASGLPVVASNIPVHREICGDGAAYFSTFSPNDLAKTIAQMVLSPDSAAGMSNRGLARSRQFSWTDHVREILDLCRSLAKTQPYNPARNV